MNILTIIPARGGSKGVKCKNKRKLHGKPLIQYTIEAAQEAKLITNIFVSTDDEEIAAISTHLGVQVPELRPEYLAADKSPTIDTVIYTLDYFKKHDVNYDAVCLLQPTCPFRTSVDIDNSIKKFIKNKTDSLISVNIVPHEFNPYWIFMEKGKQELRLAIGDEIITRRQNLPQCFVRNGAIYLTKSSVIINQKSLYGDSIGYFEMDPVNQVNIDTMEDWEKAKKIMNEKKQENCLYRLS